MDQVAIAVGRCREGAEAEALVARWVVHSVKSVCRCFVMVQLLFKRSFRSKSDYHGPIELQMEIQPCQPSGYYRAEELGYDLYIMQFGMKEIKGEKAPLLEVGLDCKF